MYNHGKKEYVRDHVKAHPEAPLSPTSQAERRTGDRQAFIAAADVIHLASGARFSTRTTDLGPGGCFVDTLVPFETGAKVRIHIRKGTSEFETTGLVIYSQAGLGMGIAFDQIRPDQRSELEAWVGEQASDRRAHNSSHLTNKPEPSQSADRIVLVRLLELLVSKGILTQAEAASVVDDSVLF
jgi:PilZ domain